MWQTPLTRKRYSTLYSTPSLAEAKHTRSSYSSRDDRQAIGSFIVYSEIAENATNSKNIFRMIPTFIGGLLSEGKMSVKVLRTNDTWYGMTYKEDVAAVKESFSKMLEDGTYLGKFFNRSVI